MFQTWLRENAKLLKVVGLLMLIDLFSLGALVTVFFMWPSEFVIQITALVHFFFRAVTLLGFLTLLGILNREWYLEIVRRACFGGWRNE